MATKSAGYLIIINIFAITVHYIYTFPTPGFSNDQTVHNRQLSEERPLQEQIAEADSVNKAYSNEKKPQSDSTQLSTEPADSDFSVLKSLAGKATQTDHGAPSAKAADTQDFSDDADSTKSRRLSDDYDSTKNGMDYKFRDDPDSFRQIDGTPLTAEDIVQKIAVKIYEEDDRGVFDRIVSKLLKLGLITDSQADTLEYEVAEALQDLITKNAKKNQIEDLSMDYPTSKDDNMEQNAHLKTAEEASRGQQRGGKGEERAGGERDDTVASAQAAYENLESRNELSRTDAMEDLQYFPNFYSLLKGLSSEKDAQERETLITIMKTLIDFVKMMVKYGTITPEEGVSYLENLDAVIAVHAKNKLGKPLPTTNIKAPTEKSSDEVDNTKEAAARMQKEYELLKDSTKENQAAAETGRPGKSEIYLDAIRKNIKWLRKHNKDDNKEDLDISKLRDFMDQQVDNYIDKGILEKDEGEVIRKIYGSM